MSASVEAFLARIYVDVAAREDFLADPRAAATEAGLAAEEVDALMKIDRIGLRLTAESLRRKREKRGIV